MEAVETSVAPIDKNNVNNNENDNPETIVASSCEGRSTMAVHLCAAGLEMTIDTAVDHNAEIICLGAKLELTTQMLTGTTQRLEAAMLRIGQLEAMLEAKQVASQVAKQVSIQVANQVIEQTIG